MEEVTGHIIRSSDKQAEVTFNKKLTPERVMKILDKNGTKVSVAEAEILLQFMKKLAHITVIQYLTDSSESNR